MRPAVVLAAIVAVAGLAPACRAEAPAVDSTSVGRGKGFSAPFWVMMRSVAVPGWGQVANRKWVKAIVLGGTETAFIVGAVREGRLATDAHRNAHDRPEEAWFWNQRADHHTARRKDYTWWGAFTLLLSAGDAYVDAHLRGFNAEFRPEDSAILITFEVRR